MSEQTKCLVCGEPFDKTRASQRWCSESCSWQGQSKKTLSRREIIARSIEKHGNLGIPMPQIKMEVTPWVDEQVGPFIIPTRWVRNVSSDCE